MNMQGIALNTNGFSFKAFIAKRLASSSWQRLSRAFSNLSLLLGTLWLSSCSAHSVPEIRTIRLQQQWSLNPGDEIEGNPIAGSLGDISLYLKQGYLKAPFDGEIFPSEIEDCALYSTPEVPAYLFRLCGLKKIAYGDIKAGKRLGKGEFLSFATLRRQPDGTWIMVEPARGVLEQALKIR